MGVPNNWRDEHGYLVSGHPGYGGRPKRGTNISEALAIRLDQSVCEQIADMMIERTLKGDRAMLEIVLDRSEGKVALAMVQDTIINVVHHIPRPALGDGTSNADMHGVGRIGQGMPDDLSQDGKGSDGALDQSSNPTDRLFSINGPLEPDEIQLDLGEL